MKEVTLASFFASLFIITGSMYGWVFAIKTVLEYFE